jgi:hypothetical protein
MFNTERLREIGLDPSTLYPSVTPRPPPIPVGDAAIQDIPRKPPSWIRRTLSRLMKKPPSDSLPQIASASDDESNADETPMGTEEEEDLRDALSPIYDGLKLLPAYWILEYLPLEIRYQRGDDSWISRLTCVFPDIKPEVTHLMPTFSINKGRPRIMPGQNRKGVKVHRSVKTREDAICSQKKYSPRPKIRVKPTWVD